MIPTIDFCRAVCCRALYSGLKKQSFAFLAAALYLYGCTSLFRAYGIRHTAVLCLKPLQKFLHLCAALFFCWCFFFSPPSFVRHMSREQ